jgi:5'-methylthioadenosine phosphorylase
MRIGIIGGSGLYDLPGLANKREEVLSTPFGAPSEALVHGELDGAHLVFLARHGRGHRIAPHEINHRANIYALKSVGVEAIISISAVGSFREALKPGHVVLVDQFVDRTKRNADHTFFGQGIVAHVGFAEPCCPVVRGHLHQVLTKMLATGKYPTAAVHVGGTYVNMEGPAFSTLAESRLYQSWGMDVIGMTNLAEAKLAREAEMAYQTVAMVTDYDCWHQSHETVSVEVILETLHKNVDLASELIRQAAPVLASADLSASPSRDALKMAIVTAPSVITPEIRQRLRPIIGKYLP